MANSEPLNRAILHIAIALIVIPAGSCTKSPNDQQVNHSPRDIAIPSNAASTASKPAPTPASLITEVSLKDEEGTLTVPVVINGAIKLNFIIDSGASDVQIPADVVLTMIRSGTLDRSDFIGQRVYELADGSTIPSYIFRIRSLKVGTLTVHNVTGSIAPVNGSLLLGQSFLSRVNSWSIDNRRRDLILGSVKGDSAAFAPQPEATTTQLSQTSAQSDKPSPATDEDGSLGVRWAANYFAVGTANDPSKIAALYAQSVDYYGKQQPVANVMADKIRYLHRWPDRTYAMDPKSITSTCNADGICTVRGIFDWTASNPAKERYAAGTAKFRLTFSQGLVTSESSRVISRN